MIIELKKALAQIETWTDEEYDDKAWGYRSENDKHDLLEVPYNFLGDQRAGGFYAPR
jgi:hypothetical protein